MTTACCDWAIVNQGRPGSAATRARTCPRHLRERTRHLRPLVPQKRARAARIAARAQVAADWARWTGSQPEPVQ